MVGGRVGLSELVSQWGGNAPLGNFKPSARYYEAMDVVLFLQEDLSYRADRVDAHLTLLWHPHEDRAIGVKLKGFRVLFSRLQEHIRSLGIEFPDDRFVPLIAALEVAVTANLGKRIVATAERQRIEGKYQAAKKILADVTVDPSEIPAAA